MNWKNWFATQQEVQELRHRCARQTELLLHVRNIIMCFNPKHYYIEQEELINQAEQSYWSTVDGLKRRLEESRMNHEDLVASHRKEIAKLREQNGQPL